MIYALAIVFSAGGIVGLFCGFWVGNTRREHRHFYIVGDPRASENVIEVSGTFIIENHD